MRHAFSFGAMMLFLTVPLSAGVTYHLQQVISSAAGDITTDAEVSAEKNESRMELVAFDSRPVQQGSITFSHDGGASFAVYEPSDRTFYQDSAEQVRDVMHRTQEALGGHEEISELKGELVDHGVGEMIDGVKTHQYEIKVTYVTTSSKGSASTKTSCRQHLTLWTTSTFERSAFNWMLVRGSASSPIEVTRLFEEKLSKVDGFPLRAVLETKTLEGEASSTTNVTNIKSQSIPSATFKAPSGYEQKRAPSAELNETLKTMSRH